MNINDILQQKGMSKYQLSNKSGIPYTTINDICRNKVALPKCSVATVYKLSKALEVPMELLVAAAMEQRPSFETFKSNVCHIVKDMGDIPFIIETLESDKVRTLYQKKWYPECLYLLAMVDYLSRENDLPLCTKYNDIRTTRLQKTVYPASIIAKSVVVGSALPKEESYKHSIPEFKRFNIVENEVRNVV